MRIRGLMPFACKSPDPNPCMPFIVNFYFLIRALEVSVLYSLRSWIKMQCTVLNVKPSGLSWLSLALRLVTLFLSNSLKALVMGTFTNHFPLVTSVFQHVVFKMFFQDVLFTAPSPSPGGDKKVILIFQRSPVYYSTVQFSSVAQSCPTLCDPMNCTGLCISHSLYLAVQTVTKSWTGLSN